MQSDQTLLDGYAAALDFIPRIAWLGYIILKRYNELASINHFVNEAPSAAIRMKKYDTALEWLGQGHSIIWGQMLHLQSPVDKLYAIDSQLANELVHTSKALDSISSDYDSQLTQDLSVHLTAQYHYQLAEKWENLIKKVQAISEFENFLQSKRLAELRQAALYGSIVGLNIYKSECDALILQAEQDVKHVKLQHISYDKAVNLINFSLQQVLYLMFIHLMPSLNE